MRELLESDAMDTMLEQAKSAYDLVVVDTPPLTAVSWRHLSRLRLRIRGACFDPEGLKRSPGSYWSRTSL